MSLEARLKRRARRVAATLLGMPVEGRARSRLLHSAEIAELPWDVIEEVSRGLASAVYLGDHLGLCRILGRYKIYLDTRDITFAAHLLLDGYWESWLTQFIARLVKPGWTVADIGASFGYYTLLLADLVGPGGRVVAVEPNPEVTALLRRSVLLNGFAPWTTIHEAAAGARDGGQATLLVSPAMTGRAMIADVGTPDFPASVRHEVSVTTLDSLLASAGNIDFMKVDVEASEERLIAGMERIFAKQRPAMVLEFNPARYADARAFLSHLTRLYGSLAEVDFNGRPARVDPQHVLDEPVERLLFLSRA